MKKVLTPELESKAREFEVQGMNHAEIAKELNVGYSVIRRCLSAKLKEWYKNYHVEYTKDWYKHHSEWVQAWYRAHPEAYKRSGKHRLGYEDKGAPKVRLALIRLLGGKCSHCGNNDPRVLQVNHVNGRGREELRKYRSPYTFYRAVLSGRRASGGLDLLCGNCNVLYEYEQGRRKNVHPLRLLAIRILGSRCIKCGNGDIRVLQINHINNKDSKTFNQWDFYRTIISEKSNNTSVNLLCANCNTLYEYERGKRRDIRRYQSTRRSGVIPKCR